MTEAYTGEIRAFTSATIPDGWLLCNGMTLQIADYLGLFGCISNIYGGDGKTTFCVPDLRGRVAVGMGQLSGGNTYTVAQSGGVDTVQITENELASHNHAMQVVSITEPDRLMAGTILPTEESYFSNLLECDALGTTEVLRGYAAGDGADPQITLGWLAVSGGRGFDELHANCQPSQTVAFYICTFGLPT